MIITMKTTKILPHEKFTYSCTGLIAVYNSCTGNRRTRGSRARGGSLPQGPADGLNEEELAGNGVRVGTLKKLLLRIPREEAEVPETEETGHPLKLISLEQVTVRGEDLTGREN